MAPKECPARPASLSHAPRERRKNDLRLQPLAARLRTLSGAMAAARRVDGEVGSPRRGRSREDWREPGRGNAPGCQEGAPQKGPRLPAHTLARQARGYNPELRMDGPAVSDAR
jgi:hypothetical protein